SELDATPFAAELSEATESLNSEQTDAPESSLEEGAETVESAVSDTENPNTENPDSENSEAQSPDAETDAESGALAPVPETKPAPRNVPTIPMERPTLAIDVEKLARSWQVGREKLKRVANCLQFSFTDSRDFQYPIPLQCRVPRLDNLQTGSMLQALVIGVADFGVFADLGPECSGLIHISRLAPEFIEDPHQFVQVGDLVPVWVLNVDAKKKRVALTAIPPGAPQRRSDSMSSSGGTQEHSGYGRDSNSRDSGNQRVDRGSAGARPNARGQGRPVAGSRPQSTAQAGSGADRRPSDGNRTSQRGNDPRGNRGAKPYGRGDNRDRNRRDNESNDSSQSRRPVRVEPAKPVTPISDAMQQGKEPLRSFSDLLQFMKKTRDEPISESSDAPKPNDSVENHAASTTTLESVADSSSQNDQGDTTPPPA
ncbi:MAG: S1 RNA-binding domain-containing protein, partial [Pirellula sp.]